MLSLLWSAQAGAHQPLLWLPLITAGAPCWDTGRWLVLPLTLAASNLYLPLWEDVFYSLFREAACKAVSKILELHCAVPSLQQLRLALVSEKASD